MFDLDNAVETEAVQDLEEVVMGLIINSGQARSLAYAALKKAKEGDFEQAPRPDDQIAPCAKRSASGANQAD